MNRRTLSSAAVLGAALLTLGSMHPVRAQPDENTPNNTGNIGFDGGFNLSTAYFYRGIPQENDDVMLQPHVRAEAELWTDGEEISLNAFGGLWNSVHTNGQTKGWHEAQGNAGVVLALSSGFSLTSQYRIRNNPSGRARTAQFPIFAEELIFRLDWDESRMIEALPSIKLRPFIEIAQELDGASDGRDQGTYIGLGLSPETELDVNDDITLTVRLPITLGLGLSDYYQDAVGNDDGFGFFEFGVVGEVPLAAWVSSGWGSWKFHGGVHFILLGDAASNIGRAAGITSQDFYVYTSWGLSFEY